MNTYSKKFFNKETQKWELLYSTEGRSAYETARLNGYTGTEAEFNKALVLAVNPDSEPTEGSENYVTSGAVWKAINNVETSADNIEISLENLRNEVTQADRDLDSKINSINNSLSTSIRDLETQTNSEIANLTNKHNSEISFLQNKDIQIETKIEEIKSEHDSDIHVLELADNTLTSEINNLKNKDAIIDGEITTLQSEDSKIKASISDLRNLIDTLPTLSVEKVHSVTEVNNPKSNVLYLSEVKYVVGSIVEQQDLTDSLYEYLYVDGKWELVGTTTVDLSDYYTKSEVNNKLTNPDLGNVITPAKFKGNNYIMISEGANNVVKDSSVSIDSVVTKSYLDAFNISWSKITEKPSTFTPSAHNQASNTITSLTGYSIASTFSSLTISDSLNVALGKLERGLLTKEPNFTKNTAFNKNFGTGSEDVARGNHRHDDAYALMSHTHTYNNLIGLPTIPTYLSQLQNDMGFITSVEPLSAATEEALGGIKLGYTLNGKNYPVLLNSNNQAYVKVPWDPALPMATNFGDYGRFVSTSSQSYTITSHVLTPENQISINVVPYNSVVKFVGSHWKVASDVPNNLTSGFKCYCLQYISASMILVNVGHYVISTDTE